MEALDTEKEIPKTQAAVGDAECGDRTDTAESEDALPLATASGQTDADDPILAEHRAALAKMRASLALDLLIENSGAKDAEIVRKLLDIDAKDGTEDGTLYLRSLKERLAKLKRDCGYLFAGDGFRGGETLGGFTTGMPLGVAGDLDDTRLSDEDYYKKHYQK